MGVLGGLSLGVVGGWLVVCSDYFGGRYKSSLLIKYLRPVSGCINAGCAAVVAVLGCGFGLLTFVLLFANSKRIVWGISGSKRTPCCKCQSSKRERKRDRDAFTNNRTRIFRGYHMVTVWVSR